MGDLAEHQQGRLRKGSIGVEMLCSRTGRNAQRNGDQLTWKKKNHRESSVRKRIKELFTKKDTQRAL